MKDCMNCRRNTEFTDKNPKVPNDIENPTKYLNYNTDNNLVFIDNGLRLANKKYVGDTKEV